MDDILSRFRVSTSTYLHDVLISCRKKTTPFTAYMHDDTSKRNPRVISMRYADSSYRKYVYTEQYTTPRYLFFCYTYRVRQIQNALPGYKKLSI